MAHQEKVVVLNKPESRKRIIIGIVIALAIIVPLSYWNGWSRLEAAYNKMLVDRTVKSFYDDFADQVNTNENWEGFITRYLAKNAETLMIGRASKLCYDAEHGSQHVFKFTTPIEVRLYKFSDSSAQVLVDAVYVENLIGGQPQEGDLQKLLVLDKINNQWRITADLDRTASFNQYVENFK
ncbi:MAG: hypothetical protein M1586_00755 [Patescibacteria group bacterium]|nr:hypothetical protein [Patescibacteria group bacterium]MCL5261815.1 hypothetical protein [Patescibacteria group bacterium]